MKNIWFKGLKPDKKEERVKLVLGNKIVLDILKEILYNRVREVETSSIDDYDSPAWAYRQADINGQLRTLKEVIQYLEVDDPPTNK